MTDASQTSDACPSCSGPMEHGVVEGTYLVWLDSKAAGKTASQIARTMTGGLLASGESVGHGFWPRQAEGVALSELRARRSPIAAPIRSADRARIGKPQFVFFAIVAIETIAESRNEQHAV